MFCIRHTTNNEIIIYFVGMCETLDSIDVYLKNITIHIHIHTNSLRTQLTFFFLFFQVIFYMDI
jgi:hypothetical protein